MTCIAIIKNKKGNLIMAGDRRSTDHWGRAESMVKPKIAAILKGKRIDKDGNPFKKGEVLLGAAGDGGLCSLLVNVLNIPDIKTENINMYMFFDFKQSIHKLLVNQGYGEAKKLDIPSNTDCELVVGIKGHVFKVVVHNPYDEGRGGLVDIDEVNLPYTTGSGGDVAIAVLKDRVRVNKYLTKEDLHSAMETAAEISPGCNNEIDFISEL